MRSEGRGDDHSLAQLPVEEVCADQLLEMEEGVSAEDVLEGRCCNTQLPGGKDQEWLDLHQPEF